MPHIRIRALSDSAVKDLSVSLPAELAKILNTPEDNFTVEKISTIFYRAGQVTKDEQSDPMIEFLWFDRGTDVRDKAAKKITELVQPYTSSKFIAVVFTKIEKDHYYENGMKF